MKLLFLAMALINIIPQPKQLKVNQGSYQLEAGRSLIIYNNECLKSAAFFNDYLNTHYKIQLPIYKATELTPRKLKELKKSPYIEIMISGEDKVKGSYELISDSKKISITGTDGAGAFYGIQSLIQLIPPDKSQTLEIPNVEINDEPRFPYRGMHLDVVRHIFPVSYIKKYIDYLALHKMNYFHWHLTDDQGWRLESKVRPELNEKGAYRDGTIIGLFPGTGVDSTRYGGWYTQEEAKEIIKYAADRYITVVPEIDIPGHCMAVLSAFPQFGTDPNRIVKPAITWGIYNRQNNVLAPSDEVFDFLKDVFNELMDVFPGEYIHMGADECAHKWWKESPKVQEYIAEHNLVDENGLQKHFASKVAKVILARGRKPIGWDEMLDNGLVDGTVVMSWRNPDGAWKAAEQGHKAILTPSAYSYFNIKQVVNEDSVCHRSRTVTLERVYKFEPIPNTLSSKLGINIKDTSLILGGQGCMWTEYFPNVPKLEYFVFPRMSAISEVYWSDPKVKSWKNFKLKLPVLYDRYKLWGTNSCPIDVALEIKKKAND